MRCQVLAPLVVIIVQREALDRHLKPVGPLQSAMRAYQAKCADRIRAQRSIGDVEDLSFWQTLPALPHCALKDHVLKCRQGDE